MTPASDILLSGWDHGEDAALWRITDERTGILSIDFITPVSDDPETYGRIAAANALSDIFAMGGRPLVALSLAAFPVNCEPLDTLTSILKGMQQKVLEAGAVLAGGHSIEDEEPKFGLAVFGEVEASAAWKVSGARAGDRLILTQSLGTGIIATALKAEMAEPQEVEHAMTLMSRLNNLAGKLGRHDRARIRACTDVTGFGLAGHLLDLLDDSLDARIDSGSLPVIPGTLEKAEMGLIPAGCFNNREHYEQHVHFADTVTASVQDLLFDPQTSGGLLVAVGPEHADPLLETVRNAGFGDAAIIGTVEEGSGAIHVG